MLFFKKRSSDDDLGLIIFLDGFSVTAAILKYKAKNFLETLEILSKDSLLENDFDPIAKNLEARLKRIFANISEKAPSFSRKFSGRHLLKSKINACLCVISSPWHLSETHSVKIRKEEPFIITKEEFDKILKDENSLFLKKIKNEFSVGDFKFIETEIADVFLNGYGTSAPFGKKAEKAEFFIYLSAVKKSFFNSVDNSIRLNFHLTEGKSFFIKTAPSLLFHQFKNIFNFEKEAILADVGSETTEFILIKNNRIEETASFNKGSNFFTRRLMNIFNASSAEAESMFLSGRQNFLNDSSRQKIDSVLKDSRKDWQNSFCGIFRELSGDYFLPSKLFIFSAIPFSEDFLFPGNSVCDFNMDIKGISSKTVASYFKTPEGNLKNFSPTMLSGAMFLNKTML